MGNGSNPNTVKYILNAGSLTTASIARLSTSAPGALVQDFITFNGGGWAINTGNQDTGANRGITVKSGGAFFGTSSTTVNLTISSPIAGTEGGGVTLTNAGPFTGNTSSTAGGFVTLTNGANTYDGPTTITSGKLFVDPDATLGNGAGDLNLNGGSLIATGSRTVTTPNPVHLNASSAITTTSIAATPQFNFGSNTFTGTGSAVLTLRNDGADAATDQFQVRLFGSGFDFANMIDMPAGLLSSTTELSSFNTTGTTQTFSGVISGTGSFKRSASVGNTGGTTVFKAQNTFSGGVLLNDGTIELGVDSVGSPGSLTSGPVGTGTITVNNVHAPKLVANGGARNVGNAIGFGGGSIIGISGSNDLTLTGDVNLGAGARTLNVNNSGQSVMSGTISGAGGSLTKDLGGVLTLTGSNTYDNGTVVNAGFLRVNNTSGSGTGTGPVTVNSSGVLGGTGTIGGAIANSGVIAPGDGGIGTLSVTGDVTNSVAQSGISSLAAERPTSSR